VIGPESARIEPHRQGLQALVVPSTGSPTTPQCAKICGVNFRKRRTILTSAAATGIRCLTDEIVVETSGVRSPPRHSSLPGLFSEPHQPMAGDDRVMIVPFRANTTTCARRSRLVER